MTTWREELAWVAGFYDGEGSTTLTVEGYPRMNIGQLWANRRTLERVQRVLGLGTIYGPYDKATKSRPGNRPQAMLSIIGYHDVQAAVAMLWTFLDEEKQQQALHVLRTCRKVKQNGKCRADLHVLNDVGRIDNRCAGCYRLKHPTTRIEPVFV
jgi:hypothetical protein